MCPFSFPHLCYYYCYCCCRCCCCCTYASFPMASSSCYTKIIIIIIIIVCVGQQSACDILYQQHHHHPSISSIQVHLFLSRQKMLSHNHSIELSIALFIFSSIVHIVHIRFHHSVIHSILVWNKYIKKSIWISKKCVSFFFSKEMKTPTDGGGHTGFKRKKERNSECHYQIIIIHCWDHGLVGAAAAAVERLVDGRLF